MFVNRLYPRATEGRLTFHNSHKKRWRPPGRPFFRAAAINFVLLQLLFLGLFSYVFGSLFQQQSHTHNISVAFVDYDKGGAIGDAVRKAYESLKGDSFPTLYERSAADFPGPTELRDAVCSTTYWAALYVESGASDRLQAALAGGPPALAYNRSDVLTYVWNEALYSTVVDSVIASPLQSLSNAARIAYSTGTAGETADRQLSSAEAVAVFANPWQLTGVNIQPTTQGSRAIYNTLVIILILIQEFFYLGTINGLYASFKVYVRIHPYRIILVRNAISSAYTLVGSLCVAGSIWAFRSGWDVSGSQLGLTWMALWLFAHLNFLTLDVFTVWLPLAYVPMALISWVILNVTSILLPFALSPAFYRVGYALPAHEVYQVLTDIWSRGCNPRLRYALPVMAAWEVAGLALSALGVFRRSHYALLGEEEQARQFQEKVDAAVAFGKRRDREREAEEEEAEAEEEKRREEEAAGAAAGATEDVSAVSLAGSTEARRRRTRQSSDRVREELAEAIEAEDVRLRRAQSRVSRACHFGPSFDLAFDQLGDDDDSEDV